MFDEPGGYDVLCDVHPGMSAFVFVTSAPYAAFTGDDGSFAFSPVVAGEYTLGIWSLDPALRVERSVLVVKGEATEVLAAPSG